MTSLPTDTCHHCGYPGVVDWVTRTVTHGGRTCPLGVGADPRPWAGWTDRKTGNSWTGEAEAA